MATEDPFETIARLGPEIDRGQARIEEERTRLGLAPGEPLLGRGPACEANLARLGDPEQRCGAPAEFIATDRAVLMPIPARKLCAEHAENYRDQPAPEPRWPGELIRSGWKVEPLDPEEAAAG